MPTPDQQESGRSSSWWSWLLPSSSSSSSSASSSTSPLPPTYVANFHDVEAVRKMKYRPLGKTGKQVSMLALGCSALGGMFANEVDEDECVDVVLRALRSGINVVDTSPWYRSSERILGLALARAPRKAVYVHTKVGRYPSAKEEEIFDFRAERVTQSVYHSLATLGLSYIDLVQVHDAEFAPDLQIILNETLPALQKLKDDGVIKNIGITGYPLAILARLLRESTVAIDCCLSYAHTSLNNTTLLSNSHQLLSLIEEKGVGLISAAPLSMGLLTHRGPPAWHPAHEYQKQVCREAAEYCREQKVDIARIALFFALSDPRVPTTLVSTASVNELMGNLRVVHETLNFKEWKVLRHLQTRYFNSLTDRETWENVEVDTYWRSIGKRLILSKVYGQEEEEQVGEGRGGNAGAAATTKKRRRF